MVDIAELALQIELPDLDLPVEPSEAVAFEAYRSEFAQLQRQDKKDF